MRVRPIHWAGRLLDSLVPRSVSEADRAWALGWLTPAEAKLLVRMSSFDLRHAIGVARRTEPGLGAVEEGRRGAVMAAALLHDVGKVEAGLGSYGRVVATLCGVFAGELAEAWQQRSGFTRRVGLYLRYGEIGSDLLRISGSDPWVIAWSREHHLAADSWSLPVEVGNLLVAADR